MACAAGFNKIGLIYAGLRVGLGKDKVCSVAVGASGNFLRRTKTVIFAVVTLKIRFGRHVINLVTSHHLFITMAFHTDLGMKFTILVTIGIAKRLDIMQIMAVVACSRVKIAGIDSLAMNRFPV